MAGKAASTTGPGLAAVLLAAGKGTRMKSRLPKVLHPIAGRPMIGHVLASLAPLAPELAVVVVAPDMDGLAAAVAPHRIAVQEQQLGTGHAVRAAREALGEGTDDLLILYGDTPFISTATLRRLVQRRRQGDAPAVVARACARPIPPSRRRIPDRSRTRGVLWQWACVLNAEGWRCQRERNRRNYPQIRA